MTLIAGIFSVASIICYWICYMLTTERVHVGVERKDTVRENTGITKTLGRLVKDRALLGIILAAILLLLASLLTQSINQYVFIDYFKNKTGLSVMTAIGIVPSLFIAPFVLPITRTFGKK